MHGTIRCGVLAGMLLGCHTGDIDPQGDDAAVGASGLVIVWSSQPATWPGDLGDGVVLEQADFRVNSLRVIGDAGPGDPRTTATAFELSWDESATPVDLVFDEAPPGVYSQISIQLDGGVSDSAFELRGEAFVNGDTWDYHIEDMNPLAFTIPIEQTLSPGERLTVGLRVNFVHAMDSIEIGLLPIDDGKLLLDETSSMMPVFRGKLVESFEIVSGSPAGR